MSEIERRDCGLWWPAGEVSGRHVILNDVDAAVGTVLGLMEGRAAIVQAGANVGVYALALARHFGLVVTAEPDRLNYACLAKNLEGSPVVAMFAAFGDRPGDCRSVEVSAHNCGANRIEAGGAVPVITIDSLALDACDCIWGDVEGYELFMLRGAAETIEQFHPVIIVEEKGLGSVYGVGPNDIATWLAQRDYQPVGRIGNDRAYRRTR